MFAAIALLNTETRRNLRSRLHKNLMDWSVLHLLNQKGDHKDRPYEIGKREI